MPLILTRRDLHVIFEDPVFLEEAFQTVHDLLVDPGSDRLPAGISTRPSWSAPTVPAAPSGQPCGSGEDSPNHVCRTSLFAAQRAEFLVTADGSLLAVAAAEAFDSWRAVTPSGLAARYLAPAGARSLGLYGTGTRAWASLCVFPLALPSLSLIRIYGRDLTTARELASSAVRHTGLVVTAEESPRVVAGADVVVLVGNERPLDPTWLGKGALLISQFADGVPAVLQCRRIGTTRSTSGKSGESELSHATLADIVCGRAVARRGGETISYQAEEIPGWPSALDMCALRRAWQLDVGQRFRLD